MLISVIVLLTALVSLTVYTQGYLHQFISSQPMISITEVDKYADSQYENASVQKGPQGDYEYMCTGTEIQAIFTLVNSGDNDGFANTELTANGLLVDSNRYFVAAHSQESNRLYGTVDGCTTTVRDMDLTITSVEQP